MIPATTVRRSRMAWFVFLLVVANLIWAAQPIAIKKIENQLGPFAMAFLPYFVITPLLLPLLIRSRRKNPHIPRPTAGDWGRFTLAGVGGQLVAQLGMTWGTVVSLASNLAILYLLIPVLTAIMASAILRERLTRLRMVCLAIGLGGALLLSTRDLKQSSFLAPGLLFGNVLLVAGCLGASFYNVYCKGLMARFPERDILIYSYITAAPASLPFLLWREPDCFSRLLQLQGWEWASFAFLPFFVFGLSMLMLFYVLQFLPVTVVLASTYLVPFFGVIMAYLLLGERLSATAIVGASVVLLSTVLIMKYDAGAVEAPAPEIPPIAGPAVGAEAGA
jgi:drug/metabolite transporter (DMT)-like permease